MVDNSYLELIDKAAALDAKIKAETMELNKIKEIIKAAIEVGELPVGKTPTKKHVLTVSAIKNYKDIDAANVLSTLVESGQPFVFNDIFKVGYTNLKNAIGAQADKFRQEDVGSSLRISFK